MNATKQPLGASTCSCGARLFTSADGSDRCARCHLHTDTCTCREDHAFKQILRATGRKFLPPAEFDRVFSSGERQ